MSKGQWGSGKGEGVKEEGEATTSPDNTFPSQQETSQVSHLQSSASTSSSLTVAL